MKETPSCGCSDRIDVKADFKCIEDGPVCSYCAKDCLKHWEKLRTLSGAKFLNELNATRAVLESM